MKTLVILGAGQFGRTAAALRNTAGLELIAYADNSPSLQGTDIGGVPVLKVEEAVGLHPDIILIGVAGSERTEQLRIQAVQAGFEGEFLLLTDLMQHFDIRSATLCRLAERIRERRVEGDIAELGVYRGDLAQKLNALFPERALYLFDTFEGFDARDLSVEAARDCSRAREGDFCDTSEAFVRSRLLHPEQARFCKGFFPDTAEGLSGLRFALVSLDADLYAPILAGLAYFYPRLNPGGMILLHDFNNTRFRGAHEAVLDYEKSHGALPLVPLCDMHGSAVIVHP